MLTNWKELREKMLQLSYHQYKIWWMMMMSLVQKDQLMMSGWRQREETTVRKAELWRAVFGY